MNKMENKFKIGEKEIELIDSSKKSFTILVNGVNIGILHKNSSSVRNLDIVDMPILLRNRINKFIKKIQQDINDSERIISNHKQLIKNHQRDFALIYPSEYLMRKN